VSECNEVASSIAAGVSTTFPTLLSTMDGCRTLARTTLPGESVQVIDNVAWSLWKFSGR